MSDPHIDIDELENEVPPATGASIPREKAQANPNPASDPARDFEDEDERWPLGSFGEMVANMNRQFRHLQDKFGGLGKPGDFEFVPPETRRHLRASQREFLLAWRSLIDFSLERLDRRDLRDELRHEANVSGTAETMRGSNKIIVEEVDE
jgi:hypothetical protein